MSGPGRQFAARADGSADSLMGMVTEFEESAALRAELKQARNMASTVRRFLWAKHVVQLRQLTPAAVERYLAGLARAGRAPKTIRNHHSAISCFCRFLIRRLLLMTGATARVRRRP